MCIHFTPPPKSKLAKVGGESLPDYPDETYPGYVAPIVRSGKVEGSGTSTSIYSSSLAVFGLIPPWAKDATFSKHTYNARSETVAEKPSYKNAWKKRQFCLVPMQRFFEPNWQTGKAQNWSIHRQDQELFAMAAIWENWVDPSSGEIVESFSLLTKNADGHAIMGQFHRPGDEKRSLIYVPRESYAAWLSASNAEAYSMLQDLPSETFTSMAS